MGRKRKSENEGLESNLYPWIRGGYKYLNRNGKYEYYPKATLEEANEIARLLNKPRDPDSVNVLGDKYFHYLETETKNKPGTLQNKKWLLEMYKSRIGQYHLKAITTKVLESRFEVLTPNARQKHRSFWVGFYQWAIAKGFVVDNPALRTLPSRNYTRKKARHTQAGYDAIYAVAEPWLQIAMELAVSSLQDRSVLLDLTRDNIVDGHLQLTRYKVEDKAEAHLSIPLQKDTRLYRAVQRALRYGVIGDTLIRKVPIRRRPGPGNTRVKPDYLTKAFKKARGESRYYDNLPADERPDFKALRSFGAWLYEKQGIPRSVVKLLMAHSSEKMTEFYQTSGYKIKRIEARADLK